MTMSMGLRKIDDLPGEVVIEILCRLPLRLVFQCKCVSKSWFKLISDPSFRVRFLCLQGDKPTIISGMILQGRYKEDDLRSRRTLSFLPSIETLEERHENWVVEATYNDLVLCYCPDEEGESKAGWTIWNPYIRKRITLPPLRFRSLTTRKGIICEPCYYYKEENGANSKIVLNLEYRCRVVHISTFRAGFVNMNIYFSETGEWREFDVPLPEIFMSYNNNAGVAYRGKLYWLFIGRIVELHALALDSNTSSGDVAVKYCRVIKTKFDDPYFGVCQNTMGLALCRGSMRAISYDSYHIHTWELRSGDDDDHHHEQSGKWCCVHRVSYDKDYFDNVILYLDSLDEDIVYMVQESGDVCRCNVVTGERDYVPLGRQYSIWILPRIHPITLSGWPTPVPRV